MSENKNSESEEPEAPVEQPPKEVRVVGLYGDIEEKKSEDVTYALLLLENECTEPIEMYISSSGGAANDMFAIYDIMRFVKRTTDISTIGMGKVMSAAVLLLAAGTKGKRKVGKYCRIMLHCVSSGTSGSVHDIRNEMDEIQYTQDQYIEVLEKETKLTKKQIKNIFSRNVNTYLTAEEAVEYGIADEVI
jgi:ATP-dependent Clp protease protease subunit